MTGTWPVGRTSGRNSRLTSFTSCRYSVRRTGWCKNPFLSNWVSYMRSGSVRLHQSTVTHLLFTGIRPDISQMCIARRCRKIFHRPDSSCQQEVFVKSPEQVLNRTYVSVHNRDKFKLCLVVPVNRGPDTQYSLSASARHTYQLNILSIPVNQPSTELHESLLSLK